MTIALIAFAVFLLLGVPIAYVLGMTTVVYIFATDNIGLNVNSSTTFIFRDGKLRITCNSAIHA